MGQFLHPYVVELYGVVTVGEPVSLPVCVCVSLAPDPKNSYATIKTEI